VRAAVEHFMAERNQKRFGFLFIGVPRVIGTNGDFHGEQRILEVGESVNASRRIFENGSTGKHESMKHETKVESALS
jgi:hypothetical protein